MKGIRLIRLIALYLTMYLTQCFIELQWNPLEWDLMDSQLGRGYLLFMYTAFPIVYVSYISDWIDRKLDKISKKDEDVS